MALTAGLSAAAEAQTIGPGQTVTSTQTLTGNGPTLTNLGTISTTSAAAVLAETQPFSAGDLTSYRILGATLNNSGLVSASNANALAGISVNGFVASNNGTIANSSSAAATGLPTVYLNNVNNLQLTNNGAIRLQLSGGSTDARLLTAYKLTNSTIINTGTIASQGARFDTLPLVFLSGDSNNVTLGNSGTIASSGVNEAVLIGNDGTAAVSTTIDGTHVFLVNPSATNITVNNSGVISSLSTGLGVGGTSSGIVINNSGTIATSTSFGKNTISVQDAASNVTIANSGLILAGAGTAIDVSSTGGGIAINNSGAITGGELAIDHAAGTAPLAISNSGIINGGIRLSQPGDTVGITGGAINGAITTVQAGAGTVTFNAPGGFTTGGDLGTAAAPLGAITIAGGTLNLGNALIARTVSFGDGSNTTLTSTVNAVAASGNLNLAGGALNLGTNALVLGANATVRTSTADGSTIGLTISPTQNGLINARAGSATVDTSANTLVIRPNLTGGVFPRPGSEYAVIATSSGANVSNALTKLSVAPGTAAALFSVGTATTSTDAFGNPLTPGKDIVLIATGSAGSLGNAATAPSNIQIERTKVNAIVSGVSGHIENLLWGATIGQRKATTPSGGRGPTGRSGRIPRPTSCKTVRSAACIAARSGPALPALTGTLARISSWARCWAGRANRST
jgi:hypothetical protein